MVFTLLLALDELNHRLINIWERFENDGFLWERSAFLSKTTCNFIVRIFKEIERGLRVKRVEQGLIGKFDPVDDFSKIFLGLTLELEER